MQRFMNYYQSYLFCSVFFLQFPSVFKCCKTYPPFIPVDDSSPLFDVFGCTVPTNRRKENMKTLFLD